MASPHAQRKDGLPPTGLVWDTKVMAAAMSCESIVFIMKLWLYFQSLLSKKIAIVFLKKVYIGIIRNNREFNQTTTATVTKQKA